MVKRRNWTHSEKKMLIDNYEKATIKELLDLLPERNADMINAQIKRLKKSGKINAGKTEETIQRSYDQRNQEEL